MVKCVQWVVLEGLDCNIMPKHSHGVHPGIYDLDLLGKFNEMLNRQLFFPFVKPFIDVWFDSSQPLNPVKGHSQRSSKEKSLF